MALHGWTILPSGMTFDAVQTCKRSVGERGRHQALAAPQDFGRNFANDATVKIPWVRPDLCGPRVLVMEWIDGLRCTDPAGIRASGLDLSQFIRCGVVSGLRQLLEARCMPPPVQGTGKTVPLLLLHNGFCCWLPARGWFIACVRCKVGEYRGVLVYLGSKNVCVPLPQMLSASLVAVLGD